MIKHQDGAPDHRYTINLEWCGYPQQMHVFRFCDYWQSAHATTDEAWKAAQAHKAARDAILSGKG